MENEKVLENKQKFDQILLEIDELLENSQVDAAYEKYTEFIKKIESNEYETDHNLKAKVYASFAYFLFRLSEYDYFFEMLIKAQDYGYSRDEIEKVVLEAFIEPNSNEFKTIYEANIKFLISNEYINIEKLVDFQELPFWLLPTGVENEYYMYHKQEKLIKEKISLYKYQDIHYLPKVDHFSDYLLLEGWSWYNVLSYTNAIKRMNKKAYIVLDNIEKFLSCMQGALLNDSIISNVLIFDNLHSINEYFKSSNTFLPRNIINRIEKSETAQNMIDEIHNYRISKENRNGENILLSICIPSFNRGNRAYDNVIHLLQSYYDDEIEIILSNNGTQNETKDYYDKIRDIDDVRMNYFAFEENQGFAINCCKICELAKGEFILLLSDEDLVDFNVLDKIMDMLNKSKETLALVKTSNSHANPSVKTENPGKDALLSFMLTSNYMSGLIFNTKLLKQSKGIEYIKENLDNSVCYWYPHMFWELLLCQYGNVQATDLILINEGKAEKMEVAQIEIEGSDLKIPYYATIEGRLEQLEGFSYIFKDLEICKQDVYLLRKMYIQLCAKTMLLVRLSINVFYKKMDIDTQELMDRTYDFCAREEFYKTNINSNSDNYQLDLRVIRQFRNQIYKL